MHHVVGAGSNRGRWSPAERDPISHGRKQRIDDRYPSGHLVPQTEFINEALAWLDAYVGPVH